MAVIVLYRMRAEQSAAFTSLRRLLAERDDTPNRIELMVCDNTPYEQAVPAAFDGMYLRDATNAGLARSYNAALQRAQQRGASWLMLLDQDTTLTADYLQEVSAAASSLQADSEVVAMIPKLVEKGLICSPILPPTYGPATAIASDAVGVAHNQLHVFNSGAVLRVAAMSAVGGFAEDFPLDYLDHATFASLQARGGKLFVLRAALQHELSSNTERRGDAAFAQRQRRVLDAEYRFYARYGSARDRWLRRLRLVRAVLGRVVRGKEPKQTWRMFRSAMRP